MLVFVIFVINVISGASCQFISTPRNQVVIRGGKLQLEWKLESNLSFWKWELTQPSETANTITTLTIVNRNLKFPSNFSHFHFTESDSSMAIYTDAVKLEDGGNYTFEYWIGADSNVFIVQVTVLDSLPLCQTKKSSGGNEVELSCAVSFRGFWIPKMKWELVDDDETAEDYPDGVVNRQFNSSNVISSIIINSSDTRKKDFRIRCTTFFAREEDDRLTMNATNIPDFNYTWTWSSADNSGTHEEAEEKEVALVVVPVVLLLVLCLIVACIVRHKIQQRNRLNGERKPGFDDEQRTGTKRSTDDETSEKDDEEIKSKDRVQSVVYDTIEYDAIGYEMPDHVFSHDGLNRSYDVPFKDRVPSGYEDPDELMILSSQYITTIPDPDKDNILTSDRLSHDPENKYRPTPLNDVGKRKWEKNISGENELVFYLEIVGDEDEMKTTRESGINRKSSSSEGSEEKNKAPATNANYTQLMPESGYAHLVP